MDPVPRAGLVGGVAGLLTTFIMYLGYRDRPWTRRQRLARAALAGLVVAVVVAGAMLFLGPLLVSWRPYCRACSTLGGLVVALFVIVVFGLGLRRGRGRAVAHLPGATSAEAGWTAAQARAAAAEAAAGDDYRRAIRYRYLATMLGLDEADRLPFDRALTNLEHLRRAPDRPARGVAPAGADLRPHLVRGQPRLRRRLSGL